MILENFIPPDTLAELQHEFQSCLNELMFETPCLAQAKIDPDRHASLIKNNMYATPQQLDSLGIAFNKQECSDYEQVVSSLKPSTLTVPMLTYSDTFTSLWLNEYLLTIVSHYMGIVPHLSEAYVRRNFPARYRTMNHYWHRDLNNPAFLLKVFFFLSDCDNSTGPHEYIAGSFTDANRRQLLNDKRYYDDEEVDKVYPPDCEERITSLVPAGTVIIEDTRGLHRANNPVNSHRDLGYAIFSPCLDNYPAYYELPEKMLEDKTAFQRQFIPEKNIAT